MRVVAAILYINVVVALICGLGIQGGALDLQDYPSVSFQGDAMQLQDYPSITFNLKGATWQTYRDFIEKLREIVTRGATTIAGTSIPVLNRVVPDSRRFVYVRLINLDGNVVTIAVDVTSLYVVAFSANNNGYFFSDSTETERTNLFVGIPRGDPLGFTGNYNSLENWAGADRGSIPLGPALLNKAIRNLRSNGRDSKAAKSLIVVIQMVSEAARFRRIEEQVRRSIADQDTFTPGSLMITMEKKWSKMSQQVERSVNDQGIFTGIFTRTVQLIDDNLQTLNIDNFNALSLHTMLAILLFRCRTTTSSHNTLPAASNIVLMGEDYVDKDDEKCTVGEPTRRISGRAGWCVDVKDGRDNDGNPIQVLSCGDGQERKQQWTFHRDGTIRSKLGKCMTAYGFKHGEYVMIYDCDTAIAGANKWVVSIDGTITNPISGLVLTAPRGATGTTLLVEKNVHAARQCWRVGDDVEPIVTKIVGFQEKCLEANYLENTNVSRYTKVFLDDCVLDRQQQRWALYSDGTIRADSDRSLRVTADGHRSLDSIIILACKGWGNQRWVFNTDGTILNPNAKLVMDVKDSDVSLLQIILHQSTGKPNQKWLTVTLPRTS
uniref:Ribosome-inactivating protein PMRIPm n=1 Tax=Polygonatum multiflorum TaxID=45371 RepID=RIPM_POLML|nr:RecName: Full=Ribosome-inactivating protein PMRIPm; Contains: RecName: Full=PMRIPm A chain; AltName: Full=rRNA N-glycosidase; Contains: RecName: Full=Linker peptide; Contains: RecName: Full=PMRIPm B chain; Flags: Precursor [Polygonatum multiflorum]AAF37218.1 ribosome inactivating protein RIPm [Polygonatum multiflorum]